MRVAKWGNSLAVRLPAAVTDALGLKEGDDIEIDVVGARVLEVRAKPAPRDLLARLRKYRGRLPEDFRVDRLEAHGRTRTIKPTGESWGRWFDDDGVTADFMVEREQPAE